MSFIETLVQDDRSVFVPGAFLCHYKDLDTACVLFEILRLTESEKLKGGDGFFSRSYEQWSSLTGINPTKVRDVCRRLVAEGLVETCIRRNGGGRWVSHFMAKSDDVAAFFGCAPSVAAVGECPICKSNVLDGDKAYYCSSIEGKDGSCRFKVPKGILARWGLVELSENDVKQLLCDGSVKIHGLIGKSKKKFSCLLKIDESNKVSILFANKNERSR